MFTWIRLLFLVTAVFTPLAWSNACFKSCGLFAGDCTPCGKAWTCDSFFKGTCLPKESLVLSKKHGKHNHSNQGNGQN